MGSIQYSASLDYEILCPDGSLVTPLQNNSGKKACWRWSKDKFEKNKALGFIEMKKDTNNVWIIYTKQYMKCDNDGNIIERTQRPMGIIDEYSSTQAAKLLKSLGIPFDYSKPVELLKYLIDRELSKDTLILDFFSGSATTAHAVMQLNAEDGGNRKFIMVQLPELTDEKSEAYKAGYKNICEIGKERIRRAGAKIKADSPLTTQHLDTGFRVLKLDSSNMKDVFYSPKETEQLELFTLVDNVKDDRTSSDLLFQVMLELGATLDSKIEESMVDGKTIYNVGDGYLVACFDQEISDDVVTAIAKMQPMYAVLRDTSMADDATATNFEQIFKTFAPNTTTKIL